MRVGVKKPIKLVQHVEVEPDWPEFGVGPNGKRVRLADVERIYRDPNDRAQVYMTPDFAKGERVYPWKEAGYMVNATGEPCPPVGGEAPWMLESDLVAIGYSGDAQLRELYEVVTGKVADDLSGPDTLEVRAARRRMFDEATAFEG